MRCRPRLPPSPQRKRKLTCAKQNDGGTDVEPSHNTAGARQDAIRKLETPQNGGIVVYKFVQLEALWTLEFTSWPAKVALLGVDPMKETRLMGN